MPVPPACGKHHRAVLGGCSECRVGGSECRDRALNTGPLISFSLDAAGANPSAVTMLRLTGERGSQSAGHAAAPHPPPATAE